MKAATLATLLMTITVLIASVGCDTTRAPKTASPDPLYIEAYPRVALEDKLEKGIVGSEPIVTPATPDTPMEVSVPLRSTLDYGIHVQYRFIFFDEAGRPMKDQPGGWRYMFIGPRVQVFMKANTVETLSAAGAARGTNPRDWRLEVRSAR